MDYFRGFTTIKQDPDWLRKIGIIALLLLSSSCIPLVGQLIMMGWLAVLMQRASRGNVEALPEISFDMDYMMKLAGLGGKALLVSLAYMLPLMLIMGLGYGCMMGALYATDGSTIGSIIAGVVGLIMLVVMIPLQFIVQCGVMRTELTDDIGAGLEFGAALDMAKVLWLKMFIASIVIAVVAIGAYIVGLIMCGIGMLLTMPAVLVVAADIRAQLYQIYVNQGGTPLQVAMIPEGEPAGGGGQPMQPASF